jgi:hypothetical protein
MAPPPGNGEVPLDEPFPALFFTARYNTYIAREAARPYWASTEIEQGALVKYLRETRSIILNNDIIAFAGHPNSPNMGILGRYPLGELNTYLNSIAAEYNGVNGKRGVRKAFYIIYATAQPRGEIGIIQEEQLQEYIRFALERDILVFIDHQIGRHDPVESLKAMFPYLRYPNVHLALDPEWRTTRPMRQIGTVNADDINRAQ